MEPVVRFEGVWKKYRIGGSQYRSLREDLARAGQAMVAGLRMLVGAGSGGLTPRPVFWALRDLNLDLAPAERIGIIGPNGAGKTTALRLMARITAATRGTVRVRGKVGALIQVGAGIHPELTGRENIFLYGSILGLKRREIRTKFDTIVSFAGIEQFLDTPVKYYSSGMRVRLGFSVAVHVDPEIMLVDEVLAVGDFEFQHRCLEKITEMGQRGCTIVYVSHDLYSVTRLCSRALFLNQGEIVYDGDAQEAVTRYLGMVREGQAGKGGATPTGCGVRFGSFGATIESVCLLDAAGREVENLESGDPLVIEIHYNAPAAIPTPDFGMDIERPDGLIVLDSHTSWSGFCVPEIKGEGQVRVVIEHLDLAPGPYKISVSLAERNGVSFYDFHAGAYRFTVTGSHRGSGLLTVPVRWEEVVRSPVSRDGEARE